MGASRVGTRLAQRSSAVQPGYPKARRKKAAI
jgi:hypothetical protein